MTVEEARKAYMALPADGIEDSATAQALYAKATEKTDL